MIFLLSVCQRWIRSLNEAPGFYMQSVNFDQGTRCSNYTQLKGLQKYQSRKTEQKVRIKSSSLPDAFLQYAQECDLTLVVPFQWRDWPGLTHQPWEHRDSNALPLYNTLTKYIPARDNQGSDPYSAFRASISCLFSQVRVRLKSLWE